MPKNPFPDSLEKRELRRRDNRRIGEIAALRAIPRLQYCGMPSVEYLDVLEWKENLRSVTAIEYDAEVLSDMRIQWARIGRDLDISIEWHHGNILDYLAATTQSFDIYNLDFYGGFVYPSGNAESRCTTALRNLITNQARDGKSFILITTFNVRDRGLDEYLKLADDIPAKLAGYENVQECIAAHKAKGHVGLLKLCYPYFCWDVGRSSNFRVTFETPYYYHIKSHLLHFFADFTYQSGVLQAVFSTEEFMELLTKPIRKMEGQLPKAYLDLPRITRIA